MKSKLIVISILFSMAFALLILSAKGYDEVNQCLFKYKSEWGKPCANCPEPISTKSYRVYFRNECYTKLDIKVATQEIDKRWKTYTKLQAGYGDTIVAYACKGTGKYLYWVKRSDDSSVELPSDNEVSEIP